MKNWQKKRLGDIAKISSGKIISSKEIVDTYTAGLYPCYGGNGLRGYVREFLYEGKYPIIGRVGALCGNVHLTDGRFFPTEHALVVSIKTDDDPKFVEYLLQSMNLNQYAKGVAQPVLSASTVSELVAYFPTPAEQRRIVEELDLLSEIIDKKNHQLDLLDDITQSCFNEMFGDPIANDRGWEYRRLDEVAQIIGGATPKTQIEEYWVGDNYWVTPAELHKERYQGATERTISNEAVRKTNVTLLPAGTVLLSSRAPIGKVAITTVPMYCNQGFKNVICSSHLNNEYVFQVLYSNTEYLNSLGTGATFKEISKKTTEAIQIAVPPIELQNRFAEKVRAIEKQKELIQLSLNEAENLLASRKDRYFSV